MTYNNFDKFARYYHGEVSGDDYSAILDENDVKILQGIDELTSGRITLSIASFCNIENVDQGMIISVPVHNQSSLDNILQASGLSLNR